MTTPRRPVVVGVDDGQTAALDYAAALALRLGCAVRVVHAYVVPPAPMGAAYGVDIPESFRLRGQEIVDAAVRHLGSAHPGLVVEPVLHRGMAPALLESESAEASVLVIGPDASKPWYFRMFEGRIAHRLVEHAACPVVVVPETWGPAHDVASVVVLTDREADAQGPLSFAREAATTRGAELEIVHVDDRAEAVEIANQAGLLVIGRPQARHLTDLATDSLAQQLVSAVGCPVAVVPADYGDGTTSD